MQGGGGLEPRGLIPVEVIGLDEGIVERVARTLRNNPERISTIDLCDTRFYPSCSEDVESVARYFIVMVAMDHRLSRPGKPYEAELEDGVYRGAELLYRLGMRKYMEDPGFFNPEHLASIRVDEVEAWLSVGNAKPPDIEVRTLLLRDMGLKITRLFNGNVKDIIEASGGRLYGSLGDPGLIDLLRVFRAFEDPVEKKPLLLAKFLSRRGVITLREKLGIPVDNHLSRIAYRLGIVMVSGSLWAKIRGHVEVTRSEDTLLRLIVRRGYEAVADKAGLDPGVVDDYFWLMGRNTCLREGEPRCDKCLFKGFCKARRNSSFMVPEHHYYDTWYY
ncbi:iron-sulfur cluster loop [Desulfurococcus mucosus]|uniref:iron-sulfur cluster loop n=1 Tax=Desulfurococcus mucosus TaxID=2275 RepID=UPI000A40E692|nr:iron-sulfur cluster loop [Desulfurococcus mucosus]